MKKIAKDRKVNKRKGKKEIKRKRNQREKKCFKAVTQKISSVSGNGERILLKTEKSGNRERCLNKNKGLEK